VSATLRPAAEPGHPPAADDRSAPWHGRIRHNPFGEAAA